MPNILIPNINFSRFRKPLLVGICLLALLIRVGAVYAVNCTWSAIAATTAWGLGTNWSLGTPIGGPAPTDNAVIVNAALNQPKLPGNKSITNFTMTSGALNLNGFTLTITGTAQFTAGTISNGTLVMTGASATFAGTTFSANCTVTATCADVYFNGSTFNGTTTITKTGGTADNSSGNNTFAGVTSITNSGNGGVLLATVTRDIYSNTITFTNTGTGGIFPACAGASTFSSNITVNSTATGGVQFGSGGGTAILAAGQTIAVGGSGFSAGTLLLQGFTQTGATVQSLTLTSAATLTFGPSSSFGGNVTAVTPSLFLNGCTFSGTSNLTKNGATGDGGNGGNHFVGATTLTNSGSNYLSMGGTNPDIFDGVTTINNPGTNVIYFAHSSAGNQFNNTLTLNNNGSGGLNCIIFTEGSATAAVTFSNSCDVTINNTSASGLVRFNVLGTSTFNGNIIMNSTSATNGIYFSYPGFTGTASLASGKTISVGGTGFTQGNLYFTNFTQSGATVQSLTLTAAGSATLYYGTGNTFNGNLTSTSPSLFLHGTRFNGTASLTKTGTTTDLSNGGNTFASTSTILNSGTGALQLAGTSADTFTGDATLTNTGTGGIFPSYTAGTTQFNGNLIVNSTNTGGVQFGVSGGLTTLANTKTISVGGSGFTAGTLWLQKFTQTGNGAAQSVTLTGTGNLTIGPSSTFNAVATFVAPTVFLNSATYNGATSITKTGSTTDLSNGLNTFSSTSTIANSGSGAFELAGLRADIFTGDATLTNTGTGGVFPAYTTGTTQFNGNIIVNSNNTGGVQFGFNGGLTTLASGKTISVGTGFTIGTLLLENFTQTGATVQSFTLTSTAVLTVGPSSTFNGNVTFSAPSLLLNGATYNGTATLTKTGITNDASNGANAFKGVTTITNTGTGNEQLATTAADSYTAAATFVNSNTGSLFPAYGNFINTFSNNITTNSALAMVFGSGGGTVSMGGTIAQSINAVSAAPTFGKLLLNNSTISNITLNTPITITTNISFGLGILVSTATNVLIINNGATATGAGNSSYTSGPVRKVGTNAFVFPVGKSGAYKPIAITAPAVAADYFTAEYFYTNPGLSYSRSSKDATINQVSACDYWMLNRTGTSNVVVTLSWNNASPGGGCKVTTVGSLKVAFWNGIQWKDYGNGGTTGIAAAGTITAALTSSAFGPFTLGSVGALPVELISFDAKGADKKVDLNWATATEYDNDYFEIERSADGVNFTPLTQVKGAGNSNTILNYTTTDEHPLNGVSYYRLKQMDFNGEYKYSNSITITRQVLGNELTIYPNPVADHAALTLQIDQDSHVEISLYDVMGVKIKEFKNESLDKGQYVFDLDISDIKRGTYFVKVSNDLQSRNIKIIKL